jgi:excisionase family DNA binding protein
MATNYPSVETLNSTILTKQEAATFVRCTTRYLERQIRAGRLRALKPTGKLVRIRLRDLDKFLESGSTIGGDSNEKSKRNGGREEAGQ